MKTPDIFHAIKPVIEAFDQLSIPYYIGGSIASSVYGIARATMDADIIADIALTQVPPFVQRLHDAYYIDEDMINDALASVSSFRNRQEITWTFGCPILPLPFLPLACCNDALADGTAGGRIPLGGSGQTDQSKRTLNIQGKGTEENTYDAIVIGSGISGGWAAKELSEKGLKTLVLERGRDVKHGEYPTAMMESWEFEGRGKLSQETLTRQKKQSAGPGRQGSSTGVIQ